VDDRLHGDLRSEDYTVSVRRKLHVRRKLVKEGRFQRGALNRRTDFEPSGAWLDWM